MSYTDLYLKFSDSDEAQAVLYRTEGAVAANPELGIEENPGWTVPNYRNIDIIGTIYERQEILDPEHPPAPIALEGFHVNVRLVPGEDPTPLQPYGVTPSTPLRVWG